MIVKENIIPREIFRAYDIRGIVETELTPAVVGEIGKAIGTTVRRLGEESIFVARDGRLTGNRLRDAFVQGLQAVGCHVIDIGQVPTAVLYYATFAHANLARSGVMITGSHNPKEFNGLKIVVGQKTLSQGAIADLYALTQSKAYASGQGSYRCLELLPDYQKTIVEQIHCPKKLKVVLDSGNGIPGKVAPGLFEQLGCEVVALFCEVDGNFPNHHPDPSRPENLQALIAKVKEVGADIGLAFDGDGDRLGVVTQSGKIIWPDRQMMLYAREVLKQHPGGRVVFDVKCSKYLADVIKDAGGIPEMYRTGHSVLKNRLYETGAVLAGEMSGHIFFNDRWRGFDDGIYTGARLVEILANTDKDADALFAELPEGVATPEINIKVSEAQKFELIEQLKAAVHFPNAEIITLDGIRVEFPEGWGLVRASNTSAMLTTRFEADSEEALVSIQQRIGQLIRQVAPAIEVPY